MGGRGAFEEAAAKARRLRDPAAYRAAADLYAGELLPADRYEAWAEDRREGLRQQYISLLLGIARLQEDDGQAIEALSKVVAEEPTHEGAHAGLMRLYARGGRREEALEQYGRLRRALGREFAGEPGAASRRLRDEILAVDNLPPRQPEGRGTLRPGNGRRDNLPVTRTSFVGRDSELVGRRPRRRSLSRSTRGRREWSIRGMRHPDRRTYDVFVASQGRCAAPGSDTEQGRRLRRSGSRLPGGAPELRGWTRGTDRPGRGSHPTETTQRSNSMTTQGQAPSMSAIKERMHKVWTSGEYARIGNPLVLIGELLCEAADLRSGDKVLDVATGSGNTAISAARRFCEVTGMDLAPESIEHARRRAEAEGMEITFEVGDAEDLSYPDASFDVVLSSIDVMFCPNQEQAAVELLRVCRPGGKIGLASWTPDGYTGKMLKTVGKHVPPPPGVKPAPLWGTEERLRELFGDGISSLEATRRTYVFRYPSAEYFVEYFRNYYGPTVRAFAALEPQGQEALARDLQELLESRNTSGDETLVVPSDYLEVVAVKA